MKRPLGVVVAGLALQCCAQGVEVSGQPLSPRVFLPDGAEFTTWEQPPRFSKTYHVAQKHPQAADENPGTEDRPFKTIQAAAKVAQAGERVLVHEGVYRERVCPVRGGSGPGAMISYEAAEGEKVVIKGSDAVDPAAWQPSSLRAGKEAGTPAAELWMLPLDPSRFPRFNPFALINCRGKPYGFFYPVYTLRRGLVFQDGHKLEQVHTSEELLAGPGRYWVEGAATNAETAEGAPPPPPPERYVLHIRPKEGSNWKQSLLEITVREQCFAPETEYLGYIRVKGFVMEQVANPFPRPQKAALSASKGHHWILEENTVRWANSIGIDAGHQGGRGKRRDRTSLCGYNLVRRNTISDCGVCGIAASEGLEKGRMALRGALVEDNRISRIGWQGCEALMENAAIKLHVAENCVVRRNHIFDTHQASGIWLDWQNVNSRVTQNLIVNTGTVRAAIFVEATFETNAVDHNLIWGCRISRNPEFYPREYGGFGVLTTESRKLIVAHNLIQGCQGAGVTLGLGDPKRLVRGQPPASHGHAVLGNIIANCPVPIVFPNKDNASDYNLYAGTGANTAWRVEQPEQKLGLSEWRQTLNFDVHGSVAEFSMELDRDQGRLRIAGQPSAPVLPRMKFITCDALGVERSGEQIVAGPFAELSGRICQLAFPPETKPSPVLGEESGKP